MNMICQMFGEYRIRKLIAHFVPGVGTNTTGQVAIGVLSKGVTLPDRFAVRYQNLLEMDAIATPIWSKVDFRVDTSKFSWNPIISRSPSDIDGCLALHTDDENIVLWNDVSLMFEYDVDLRGASTGTEFKGVGADTVVMTVDASGFVFNVSSAPFFGYVVNVYPEGDWNCDVGEYIACGPVANSNVHYADDFVITHNGTPFRYQDANDRAVYYIIKLSFN